MLDHALGTLTQIGNRLRTTVGDALGSASMDGLRPVRLFREALGTVNDLVGRPFCTSAELAARTAPVAGTTTSVSPEPAPVVVYFDGKDHRTKKKVEELLQGKNVPFRVLDVADDEATRSFAVTAAKADEFPLVFIAGTPVGGLHELMQLDVNGGLARMVFGA